MRLLILLAVSVAVGCGESPKQRYLSEKEKLYQLQDQLVEVVREHARQSGRKLGESGQRMQDVDWNDDAAIEAWYQDEDQRKVADMRTNSKHDGKVWAIKMQEREVQRARDRME